VSVATPLGHMCVGLAWAWIVDGSRATRGRAATSAACAALADLDFLPGLAIGDPARFHHGPSHSVAVLTAMALGILACWSRIRPLEKRDVALVLGAVLSHLVIDFFTDDPGIRRGLPLAWPLSTGRVLSPLWVIPAVERAWPLNRTWVGHTAWLVLAEAATFAPWALGAWVAAGRPGLTRVSVAASAGGAR